MKNYVLQFGSGNPAAFSGLTPTFTIFSVTNTGQTLAPPSVAEIATGVGLYKFTYGPTLSITFVADGGAALSDSDRYITGVLDPIQSVDESVGMSSDSIGTTATDPSTIYGQIKRMQEYNEGQMVFTKSTGTWDIKTRGGTLIAQKELTNTTTSATRT
jgi:hypothetical protein